ncbi:hypothetical protein CFP56_000732 [Quercus suber]|uniref:Uncharacterized protein n=1 Tax=Quercus suber TaxID=58331 RepID=A0AAW0INX8_QUESU
MIRELGLTLGTESWLRLGISWIWDCGGGGAAAAAAPLGFTAGTSTTPVTTTPSTTTPSTTTPSTTTPTTTTPTTASPYTTTTPSNGVLGGIGTIRSGINTDDSHGGLRLADTTFFSFFVTILFTGLMFCWS